MRNIQTRNVQENKEIINNDFKTEIIYDPKFKEFSRIKLDLSFSMNLPDEDKYKSHQLNYDNLTNNIVKLYNYWKLSKDIKADILFRETVFPFIQNNISEFSTKQLLAVGNILFEINYQNVNFYEKLNFQLEKKFTGTSKEIRNEEIFSKLLFNYLILSSERTMLPPKLLNLIVEHFAGSNYLTSSQQFSSLDDVEALNRKLYDFIWFVSLGIAGNLEREKDIKLPVYQTYLQKNKILNPKAAKAFLQILNNLEKIIYNDTNFSSNSIPKTRLYKALYYLKADGILIKKNTQIFLDKFKPFYQMNVENTTRNSLSEKLFEDYLKEWGYKYEKEKKLEFCAVDFFIHPNIVVEVNGPSHFFCKIPLAKDFLKQRIIELENHLIKVEPNNLKSNPMQYKQLIEEKLAAGQIQTS